MTIVNCGKVEINIHRATLAEIDQVHRFMHQFFLLKLEGVSLRPDGMKIEEVKKCLPESMTDTNKVCFLAFADKSVVGMLSFSRYTKIEYQHSGDFGMVVCPEYWGNGIGTACLHELEKWCSENGISKIELGVWSNNDQAIRLYERFGYLHEGRRKGSIIRDTKVIDLILMGKFLVGD